jgi:hypothetical protein
MKPQLTFYSFIKWIPINFVATFLVMWIIFNPMEDAWSFAGVIAIVSTIVFTIFGLLTAEIYR